MYSLRRRLILGTIIGTTTVLLASGVLLYVFVRAGLLRQFDRSLIDKARLLASTVEVEFGEVSVEFEPFPALAKELKVTVVVECSVLIDPQDKTITVRPYPGQLDQAKAEAVEKLRMRIAEAIGDDGKRVFAGTP